MDHVLPAIPRQHVIAFDIVTAKKVGIDAAIILHRMCVSINSNIQRNKKDFQKDGHWWTKLSVEKLCKEFSFSRWRVKSAITLLRRVGLVIAKKLPSFDRTNYFTVNESKLLEYRSSEGSPLVDNQPMEKEENSIGRNPTNALVGNQPIDWSETDSSIGRNPTNVLSNSKEDSKDDSNNQYTQTSAEAGDTSCSSGQNDVNSSQNRLNGLQKPKNKKGMPMYSKKKKRAQDKNKAPQHEPCTEELNLAEKWLYHAQTEIPNFSVRSPYRNWTKDKLARDIAKVKRSTGFDQTFMENLFQFIRNDQFWAKNVLAPIGLLTKSKNGKMKIDNIITSWRPDSDRRMANFDPNAKSVFELVEEMDD
jgi:hypothetical protein